MKHLPLLLILCTFCACHRPQTVDITILHTNDTHSQIEPLGAGSRNAGKGGYARRMGVIAAARVDDPDVLLLDAGDFSQGTPYFNFFKGRVEIDALNRMGYDVVTLGNHEFDNGLDTLARVLQNAHFQVVCTNYKVENTPLEGLVKPYVIVERKGIRIGILGAGVQPDDLIDPTNFAPVEWVNPLPILSETADYLREKQHCDLIICLSHLGTDKTQKEECDVWLAENTRNIDVILGGHTHKVVTNRTVTNVAGNEVILSQMGKSGAHIGRLTVHLER